MILEINENAVKQIRGDFVIYNRKWLYHNAKTEMEHMDKLRLFVGSIDKEMWKELKEIFEGGETHGSNEVIRKADPEQDNIDKPQDLID